MTTFLTLALSFPTAIFSTLLVFIVLYWALVLVGAVGFEFGGEGALEAKTGAIDAKTGAIDAKGGVMEALGFGVVPGSVVISFIVFWAWSVSLMGAYLVGPIAGGLLPVWAAGSAVAVVALFASLMLSAVTVKPLRPLFEIQSAPRRRELLGKTALVSSGRVDGGFGTATMEDGGSGLILNVFCGKENTLKKGDQVLLLQYDESKQAYEVEPVDWLLPEELQQLNEPRTAEAVARAHARQRVGR